MPSLAPLLNLGSGPKLRPEPAPGLGLMPLMLPEPIVPLPVRASPRLIGGGPPLPPGEIEGPDKGDRATELLGLRMGNEPAAPAFLELRAAPLLLLLFPLPEVCNLGLAKVTGDGA